MAYEKPGKYMRPMLILWYYLGCIIWDWEIRTSEYSIPLYLFMVSMVAMVGAIDAMVHLRSDPPLTRYAYAVAAFTFIPLLLGDLLVIGHKGVSVMWLPTFCVIATLLLARTRFKFIGRESASRASS
jgi:hypothetical protein